MMYLVAVAALTRGIWGCEQCLAGIGWYQFTLQISRFSTGSWPRMRELGALFGVGIDVSHERPPWGWGSHDSAAHKYMKDRRHLLDPIVHQRANLFRLHAMVRLKVGYKPFLLSTGSGCRRLRFASELVSLDCEVNDAAQVA